MKTLRIATRNSPLAMWQARFVQQSLSLNYPSIKTELVPLTSSGDQDTETPLYGMGTNIGVFAKEVHLAMLDGRADIGVHSCKDLPTTSPDGITLAALLQRDDPRDVMIGCKSLADLPTGACIGTSSLRRRHQLAALRPDLTFTNIRGNIQTRMRKVQDGEVAATLLAAAGLQRMGLMRASGAIALDPYEEIIPAAAQGAMAVDCLSHVPGIIRMIESIGCYETECAVTVERTILAGLEGGCSLPLGVFTQRIGNRWLTKACLASENGDLKVAVAAGPLAGMADAILAQLR